MVKLGFQVLNAGSLATPANVVEMARKAEALGYDSMVVTDHIVIPRRIESRYPYNVTGRLFVPPDADYLEPISMFCFLAGATRTIRFGPSVLVLPYRNPVLTAKMLATIDVLSGGRLFVGIGAGWLAEEFAAMGAPPFERGTAAQVAEQLKPIVDLEPTHAIFDCRTGPYPEVLETMERLAGEVWPKLEGRMA